MIELTGSQKQIEWATEIRNNFVTACDKAVAKVEAGQASYVHPKVRARFCEMIHERRDALLEKQSNAAKWIDLRSSLTVAGVERTIADRIQQDEKAKAAMSAPRQREVQS